MINFRIKKKRLFSLATRRHVSLSKNNLPDPKKDFVDIGQNEEEWLIYGLYPVIPKTYKT